MYKNLAVAEPPETRTMEVHQGEKGWYYTIHKGIILYLTSGEFLDRGDATREGLGYLDFLNTCDYEARLKKKGEGI